MRAAGMHFECDNKIKSNQFAERFQLINFSESSLFYQKFKALDILDAGERFLVAARVESK